MPSQVSNGCLLQFADDTCLICSAESPSAVAAMLLNALFQWIVMSKMRLNLKKSSVMWFSIKPSAAAVPRVMVGDTALSVVCKQKYLGVIFDSQLNWSNHVASVCKSMSYYLALIGSHVRNLPSSIIKMLVECLVFSRYSYALPVWGPAAHRDSLSRLARLHNRGVRLTCGLRKYDHVSQHRTRLGWLPVESFVKYRSLITLFRDYYVGRGVSLNPALQFGRTHSYGTRCPAHHITTSRLKKSFSQKHFRHNVSTWWNSLPSSLFQNIEMFHHGLFTHLFQETIA